MCVDAFFVDRWYRHHGPTVVGSVMEWNVCWNGCGNGISVVIGMEFSALGGSDWNV